MPSTLRACVRARGRGRLFQQSDYSLSVLVAHPIGAQRLDWQSGILARNPLVRPCSEISRGQIDAARFDSAHKDQ